MNQDVRVYHLNHSVYEILRSPLGCIFGSYVFMSKGIVYPFIENCRDIVALMRKTDTIEDP
jgi:hypothetical protein